LVLFFQVLSGSKSDKTMSNVISKRIQALAPSATMAMAAKAKEIKAASKTVYDFSLGEPDFNTPKHICEAATKAMESGHTHYTVASGIPELKTAVAEEYQKIHGLQYAPSHVTISNGAKHSLHNIFTCLLDAGDEVIIPAPYWVSYAEQVRLAEGTPVIVSTKQEENFNLTPEAFEAAITEKTKILLLCSPSNPTGSMYSGEQLAALGEIAVKHDLLVIADEIYEKLVYGDGKFVSLATALDGLQDRTIIVNGVSKAYAMTGWRIGWTLAPEEIAKAMGKLQGQETSNPCSISQYAAIAALKGPQDCVSEMHAAFAERREYVRSRIEAVDGLSTTNMDGAFYAFINIQTFFGRELGGTKVENSSDFCLGLLEQQQVATVMGSAFGAEGFLRMSYATSMENIEAGFDRLVEFIK
jgi:aspartate aminotransferase